MRNRQLSINDTACKMCEKQYSSYSKHYLYSLLNLNLAHFVSSFPDIVNCGVQCEEPLVLERFSPSSVFLSKPVYILSYIHI